jgi:hypothetical protein
MDLNKIALRIAADPPEPVVPKGMAVVLKWTEPEQGSATMSITDATDVEIAKIAKWVKAQAGEDWGQTIPSISKTKREPESQVSLEDFASSIRYNTGEEVYTEDCPVFADRGIKRS